MKECYCLKEITTWLKAQGIHIYQPNNSACIVHTGILLPLKGELSISIQTDPQFAGWAFCETLLRWQTDKMAENGERLQVSRELLAKLKLFDAEYRHAKPEFFFDYLSRLFKVLESVSVDEIAKYSNLGVEKKIFEERQNIKLHDIQSKLDELKTVFAQIELKTQNNNNTST